MQIVISKTYFDNIKVAIDAMNNFFASNFKTKSFPVVNNDFELDRILTRTMSWLNNVEPSWIENPNNAVQALDTLKQAVTAEQTVPSVQTESAQFVQEFTLLEMIATCAAVGVASSLTSMLVRHYRDKKAYEKQTFEKAMFEQLKVVAKLIESTKDFAIMKSDWNFDGPKDDDHDWYNDQLDFKAHCDKVVAELAQLGDCLKKCEEKKTALYLVIPKETREFSNFIWETIDPFTLGKINYDKKKFYTHEDIDPIKTACDEFETTTREFAERYKQIFTDIVNEAVEEVPADPSNPWVKIISGENKAASDVFHAFIGFKVLQYITNNFDKYEQLMNGIYSFELFTTPSKYREAITVFTTAIPMPELDAIAKLPGDYKLFDASDYVNSIFDNDQIKLPETMQPDTEIQRFQSFGDLQDCEIIINDAVQEAAAIDYFTSGSENIKYSNGKWKVSKSFESAVDTLIKKLRECNTTEDLVAMLQKIKINGAVFANTVVPAILVRVLTNPRKYPVDQSEAFTNYTKSYLSIVKKNGGAKRFERIDLFSTFKTDKEGTIQFLEDFLKLNLVNNSNAVISNNTLLSVFNIFDSHIYLSLMYKAMGDDKEPLDGFIKRIRARINQNSHSANPYQTRKNVTNTIEGSSQVVESVMSTMKELGNLSIADMQYCESFAGAVYDDIETIGDAMYNNGMSAITVDRAIGNSHSVIAAIVQEAAENGEMPRYIQSRLGLSDKPKEAEEEAKQKAKKKRVQPEDDDDDIDDEMPVPDYMKNRMDSEGDIDTSIVDIQLPPDVPANKPEELASSINARLTTDATSLGDMLGADYKGQIKPANHGGPGSVVYNITNNYSNSHNTTTHNDLSQKSNVSNITTTNNDLSQNKRTNSGAKTKPTNNYDNTRPSSISKESDTFSNGKSVQEVFALLHSEEPLIVESVSGNPPKGDMLTAAMDVDKATLPAQQKLKRGVQYVKNTGEAIKKPIRRTKDWLRTTVDSFIKRDEERVKADLVENPSYRSALYKISRLAIKTGKFALFFSVSPWLGALDLAAEGAKALDRDRLRKEAESEINTEIQIVDEKIEELKHGGRWGSKQSAEDRQELYRLMRMRQKLVDMSTSAHKQRFANPKSVY